MLQEALYEKDWLIHLELGEQCLGGDDHIVEAVKVLTHVVDLKDSCTVFHSRRVSRVAVALAQSLNWAREQLRFVELAGLLHDIGKVAVMDDILTKNAELEGREKVAMRQHPQIGARILMGFDSLQPIVPYVLYHHERWDGRGYPFGLKKTEIPREGRLLALCDAFDAMTSTRPYRPALGGEAAFEELGKNKASQFDPDLLDVFALLWESGEIVRAIEES